MAARAPTRADVAREAGVSAAVVSYVVNGGPRRVAPETAARVRAAVLALGYRPNVAARALSRSPSRLLGLVVPDFENVFFGELAQAVETAAQARGYLVVIASSVTDVVTERRIVADLAGRHVDGLLLATVLTPAELRRLPHPGRPTVLINASAPFAGYPSVGPASRKGAYALVDHLVGGHGHSSVALVIGTSSLVVPEPREVGWAEVFRTHGLPPGPVLRTEFSHRGGYDAGREMLRWPTRPSAVFVSSDQQCVGVLRAFREAGLRCPDDVALVSFDGTAQGRFCWPPLTVARQPVEAMAAAALDAVLDDAPPSFAQLPTELVLRTSCGCPDDGPSSRWVSPPPRPGRAPPGRGRARPASARPRRGRRRS